MYLKEYMPRYKKGILDLTKKHNAGEEHLEVLLKHSYSIILLMFNEKNKLRGFVGGLPKDGKFIVLYCLGKTRAESETVLELSKDVLKENFKSITMFDQKHKTYDEGEL